MDFTDLFSSPGFIVAVSATKAAEDSRALQDLSEHERTWDFAVASWTAVVLYRFPWSKRIQVVVV